MLGLLQVEGAGEEGRHLGSYDGLAGAESQGLGRAADCDAGGCEGVDVGSVDAGGVNGGSDRNASLLRSAPTAARDGAWPVPVESDERDRGRHSPAGVKVGLAALSGARGWGTRRSRQRNP